MVDAICWVVLCLLVLLVLRRIIGRYQAEYDAEHWMKENNPRNVDVVVRMRGHKMSTPARKAAELWLAERVVKGYRDE